jgi:hypothetical protein
MVYVGSAGIRRRVGAQAASPHHRTIGTSNPILACAEEKCRDIGTVQRFAMSLTHIASSQCTMLARKDLHKCLRAHGAEDHVRGTRSMPSHAAMSRRPCAQDHDTQETS